MIRACDLSAAIGMNPARYRLISHDKGEWKLKSPMLTITTLVFEQPPSTITRYGKNEPVIRAESYPRDGREVPFQWLSAGYAISQYRTREQQHAQP